MNQRRSVFTEKVQLPSRGLTYPPELEVPKEVFIRPFNTEDQKGLYGVGGDYGLEMLIDNCLNHDGLHFKAKDLLIADQALIIIRLRAITLGASYPLDYICPHCGRTTTYEWDLNSLDVMYLECDQYPIPLTLPNSNDQVTVQFPSAAALSDVEDALVQAEGADVSFDKDAERPFYIQARHIDTVSGKRLSIKEAVSYFSGLSAIDSSYIQFVLSSLEFGPILTHTAKCQHKSCKKDYQTTLRTGLSFFRPRFQLPAGLGVKKASLEGYTAPAVSVSLSGEGFSHGERQNDSGRAKGSNRVSRGNEVKGGGRSRESEEPGVVAQAPDLLSVGEENSVFDDYQKIFQPDTP